jgi:hypothetical protein
VAEADRSAGESNDQRERPLRPGPELADQVRAAGPDKAAEDEREDDRVVELSGDGDEVGDEVEREREVAGEGEWEQFALPR